MCIYIPGFALAFIIVFLRGRLVHAFTCAGILPSQYIHFCQFATLGVVGKWYIQQGELAREMCVSDVYIYIYVFSPLVYKAHSYIECIAQATESSMKHSIEIAKLQADYTVKGEVCIP